MESGSEEMKLHCMLFLVQIDKQPEVGKMEAKSALSCPILYRDWGVRESAICSTMCNSKNVEFSISSFEIGGPDRFVNQTLI